MKRWKKKFELEMKNQSIGQQSIWKRRKKRENKENFESENSCWDCAVWSNISIREKSEKDIKINEKSEWNKVSKVALQTRINSERQNEVTMWINSPFCSLSAGELRLVGGIFLKAEIRFVRSRLLCINSKNLRHETRALCTRWNVLLNCFYDSRLP